MVAQLRAWCVRHWQPYFDGRANGARATRLLATAYINSLNAVCPDEPTFTATVERVIESGTPICCLLEEQDHDELVMNAGPADPLREDIKAEKITVALRYGSANDEHQ